MRTVYIVTHPESTHHVNGLVGGWHDAELTDLGRAQAHAVAAELRRRVVDGSSVSIVASDLVRAALTAEIVGTGLGTAVLLDEGFREKSYGVAEGKPQTWLNSRFAPPPATGDRMGHDEGVAGSETKRQFATRIYGALERALQLPSERLIIVTHGFALTFVCAAFARLPVEGLGYLNLRARAGSITVMVEDDFFHNRQLVELDNVDHLKGLA